MTFGVFRSMKTGTFVACLAVAVAALAGAAAAAQGGSVRGKAGGERLAMMGGLRQLGLSDAQRGQIRDVLQSHRDEFAGLAERRRSTREKLNAAVTSNQVDENAIRDASADLATVDADAAVLRAKVHSEIWALLTPEQQAKAESLRAAVQQRMSERRNRMQERLKGRAGNPQF